MSILGYYHAIGCVAVALNLLYRAERTYYTIGFVEYVGRLKRRLSHYSVKKTGYPVWYEHLSDI